MKFFYSPRNNSFFPYQEHLVGQYDFVVVDWHERQAMLKGASWESVLSSRRAPGPAPVQAPASDAPALIVPDVPVKEDPEREERRVTINIPASVVRAVAVDKAEAGEPDALDETKRTFSDIGHWNATPEMLAQVADEELHQFAKHALEKDYPPIPDGDDEEKREAYRVMREDIARKLKIMVRRRAKRAERTKEAEKNG